MCSLSRESRRKTPVIVAIKGKDREFGEAALSRVSENQLSSFVSSSSSSQQKFPDNLTCTSVN